MAKSPGFGFTESAVQIPLPGLSSYETPSRSLGLSEPVCSCGLRAFKQGSSPPLQLQNGSSAVLVTRETMPQRLAASSKGPCALSAPRQPRQLPKKTGTFLTSRGTSVYTRRPQWIRAPKPPKHRPQRVSGSWSVGGAWGLTLQEAELLPHRTPEPLPAPPPGGRNRLLIERPQLFVFSRIRNAKTLGIKSQRK